MIVGRKTVQAIPCFSHAAMASCSLSASNCTWLRSAASPEESFVRMLVEVKKITRCKPQRASEGSAVASK